MIGVTVQMVKYNTIKATDSLSEDILTFMASSKFLVFGIGNKEDSKAYAQVPCALVQNGVLRIFGEGDNAQEQFENLDSRIYDTKEKRDKGQCTIAPDLMKVIEFKAE